MSYTSFSFIHIIYHACTRDNSNSYTKLNNYNISILLFKFSTYDNSAGNDKSDNSETM